MSREQIDAARDLANQVRDERAVLRARVRPLDAQNGRYELAAILEEPGHDTALKRMPVIGFLKWSKRMLPEPMRRYLAEAGCSEYKLIGGMSPRQRAALAEALRLSPEQLRDRERERHHDRAALVWAEERNRKAAA